MLGFFCYLVCLTWPVLLACQVCPDELAQKVDS